MAGEVRVEGLDALIRDFAKLGDSALKNLEPAVIEAGNVLLNAAKQELAAVTNEHTGKLRRSLHVKKVRESGGAILMYLTWGDDVREYAAPLELGHALRRIKKGAIIGRVKPHPFMRPAADKNKARIHDIIIDAMNKTIAELGDKK